jgi:hypothetical protein
MTFEEWLASTDYTVWDNAEKTAEAAWDYQHERIKLLEQRIIDLQGHDDLSYIDKKLSEQEEVERLRAADLRGPQRRSQGGVSDEK